MTRGCEICRSLAASTGALVTSQHNAVFRVLMSDRLLVLCAEHAAEVENTRATSLDELRGYFLEPFPGQRSLIPRRSVYEPRRAAPESRSPGQRSLIPRRSVYEPRQAAPASRSPGRRAGDRISADES